MNDEQRELSIEQATTAWRPRTREGEIGAHPAFWDLDAAGRGLLFAEIERQRLLEAALNANGLSTTARAVLARIRKY